MKKSYTIYYVGAELKNGEKGVFASSAENAKDAKAKVANDSRVREVKKARKGFKDNDRIFMLAKTSEDKSYYGTQAMAYFGFLFK